MRLNERNDKKDSVGFHFCNEVVRDNRITLSLKTFYHHKKFDADDSRVAFSWQWVSFETWLDRYVIDHCPAASALDTDLGSLGTNSRRGDDNTRDLHQARYLLRLQRKQRKISSLTISQHTYGYKFGHTY